MWKHIVRALIQILKAIKVYLAILLITSCATTPTYIVKEHNNDGSIVNTYYTKDKLDGLIYQGPLTFKTLSGDKVSLNGLITIGVIK